jgi:Xaa-Pro aminopeptidase
VFINNVKNREFINRQNKCIEKLEDENLSGLMIWSRGGGVFDRYANVDYLANHYQQRCFLPDYMPLWSGRSHTVLFLTQNSDPVLIVSSPEYKEDLIMVDDIRYNTDFAQEIVNTIKELNMDHDDIGIIGSDVMTYHHYINIIDNLPELSLIEAEHILNPQRRIKSTREKTAIKHACEIGTKAIDIAMENVQEGLTESQVIAPAIEKVFAEGAALYFVVTSSGPYSNSAHSIDFPGYDGDRLLKNGEIFRIDLIIAYDGYICDFGRSTIVGGNPSKEQKEMLDLVTNSCEYLIDSIKPGMKVSELVLIGDNYLKDQGVSLAQQQDNPNQIYAAYPPHWGHGIGMTWERPWLVKDEDIVIKPNMFLAVEKALYKPGTGTVSYEQNFLVTENGTEVLTKSKKKWY